VGHRGGGDEPPLPHREDVAVEVNIQDGQVILTGIKMTLTLSKEEFIAALQRGKSYTRQQAMQARLTRLAENQRTSRGA
jgi:hypothetical protein